MIVLHCTNVGCYQVRQSVQPSSESDVANYSLSSILGDNTNRLWPYSTYSYFTYVDTRVYIHKINTYFETKLGLKFIVNINKLTILQLNEQEKRCYNVPSWISFPLDKLLRTGNK